MEARTSVHSAADDEHEVGTLSARPPVPLLPPGLYTRSAGRFYSELLVEEHDNLFAIAWHDGADST